MDDLNALLEDLDACIPAPINFGPKPVSDTAQSNDIILNEKLDSESNMPSLHGNLSELDALLDGLYSSEDPPAEKPKTKEPAPLPPVELDLNESTQKSKNANTDLSLQEIDGPNEAEQKNSKNSSFKQSTEQSNKNDMPSPSAANELDELMMSLAGFGEENMPTPIEHSDLSKKDSNSSQIAKTQSDNFSNPNYEKIFSPLPMPPNPNDLDVMLEDMNIVLGKQGIRANSKGLCHACKKPVMGEVTTALGKVWHPEHFVCAECDQEIGTKTFFEREGKPYCEKDYHNLFSPPCAYCHKPVLGQCVTALNNTWHPEHFFCAKCSCYFGDEGFHEHDGKPYCRADFYNLFAPHCASCNKPILSNYISALNAQWHPECFVCGECLAPFTHGSFFELEGRPFCETHYHLLRGSLCAKCHKPITGRCITAMGKKFHPEHFTCAFCLKQLNKGTFKENKSQPYCHQCFTKLFGAPEAV